MPWYLVKYWDNFTITFTSLWNLAPPQVVSSFQCFRLKFCKHFSFPHMYTCPVHTVLINLITLIIFFEKYSYDCYPWGFHGGKDSSRRLLDCDGIPMFRRPLLSPSSAHLTIFCPYRSLLKQLRTFHFLLSTGLPRLSDMPPRNKSFDLRLQVKVQAAVSEQSGS
jgi:hypothetical protein